MGLLTPTLVRNDTSLIRVAKIIDNYTVIINRGAEDGVKVGDTYLIYSLEDNEILDPITQVPLGYLELAKGIGEVTHVQDKLATIQASKLATIQTSKSVEELEERYLMPDPAFFRKPKTIKKLIPFNNPTIGDLVKQI